MGAPRRMAYGSAMAFGVLALIALAPAGARSDTPRREGKLTWMTVEEIRRLLVDNPAAGVYPDGVAWTETMHAGGRTDYAERGERRTGDWSFNAAGELCFRYDHQKGGGCFRYVRLGANCYEHFVEIGPRGEPPGDGPGARFLTNGKLWRTNEPATCDERPSV